MDTRKLLLRPAGMFSNVNEVVQQIHLATQQQYQFVIDWSASCYRDPSLEGDPWNYYFEDCFPGVNTASVSGELPLLPGGSPVACARNNIITPRLVDNRCNPLLLPKNRLLPGEIIARHIRIRPHIREVIRDFIDNCFTDYTIGLHVRGPGRIDGGAPGMRSRYPNKQGVPFGQYFRFVDEQLREYPDAGLFVCSDSGFVIREIIARYGDRVVTYESTRSEFGEMHVAGHPANQGTSFPAYKLGEDVLVEACLLCETDYLVHGNSNVVNFVICRNPSLDHRYVYAES